MPVYGVLLFYFLDNSLTQTRPDERWFSFRSLYCSRLVKTFTLYV